MYDSLIKLRCLTTSYQVVITTADILIADTSLQQLKKEIYGIPEELPRYKTCMRQTSKYLDLAVGAIYADKYFSSSSEAEVSRICKQTDCRLFVNEQFQLTKSQVRAMVENLQQELATVIHNLHWMDGTTKNAAKEKVIYILQLGQLNKPIRIVDQLSYC